MKLDSGGTEAVAEADAERGVASLQQTTSTTPPSSLPMDAEVPDQKVPLSEEINTATRYASSR